MSHRVAFISQNSYEPGNLATAVRRAVELAGFDLRAVSGRRVLLKPNMLGAYPPEMGITTHPEFVKAVAILLRDAGALVSIGDSPNGVHTIERSWDVSGFSRVCEETGAEMVRFEASGSVERGDLRISRAVAEADVVVNLPKFKTHGLTVLTLGAKNLYGCINGMTKTRLHRDLPNPTDFADMIARLASAVKPALTIIDGIIAMDGNSPGGGHLLDLGVVVAGTDVHAVDAACCRLVGLKPMELETLAAARKLKVWDPDEPLEIVGDAFETLKPRRFDLPATYTRGMRDWWLSRFVMRHIWKSLSAQPIVNSKRCERCLLCIDACPVAAIDRKDAEAPARIDVDKCIQCHCCHEVCPHRAIDLKRSALLRLAGLLAELNRRMATKH